MKNHGQLAVGTAHIRAKKSDFAKTVLLPGDPLRARWIAKNFLTDVKQINDVRNMFGYTGKYKGRKITVMGSGMGIASAGIYSYEMFAFLGVENIIRVGTAGAYNKNFKVGTVVVADKAYSESSFATLSGVKTLKGNKLAASKVLIDKTVKAADKLNIEIKKGTMHSSDIFYNTFGPDHYQKMGIDAVEMEAFALYTNAKRLKKNALTICTISDNIVTGEQMSAKERQTKLKNMVDIALNVAIMK